MSEMELKLTRPQRRLLAEVAEGDDGCSDTYGPAIHLVKIGLLEWATDYRLRLTEEGAKVLAEIKKETAP